MFQDPFLVPPHLEVWEVTYAFNYLTEVFSYLTKPSRFNLRQVTDMPRFIWVRFALSVFITVSPYGVAQACLKLAV